jgi:hypothetical protein
MKIRNSSNFTVCSLFIIFASVSGALSVRGETVLRNPLRADQLQAPVRVESPANHQGSVLLDGEAVPSQWEMTPEGPQRWILADLPGGHHAEISYSPQPAPAENALHLRESGDDLEFTNGVIVGRVPLRASGGAVPPPIQGIRLREGGWLGEGFWRNAPPLESYELNVLGRGPVQITLLQEYRFEGGDSLRLRIRLRPGRDFLEIEERVNLPEGTAWGYDVLAGGNLPGASESLFTRHGGGAGRPMNTSVMTGTLLPGQSRMGNVLVFLLPRWSQTMDDGWMAAAANEALAVGAVTVRAGQWTWPHEGKIAVELSDAEDAFRLVMPGIRNGARMWWLRAAPRETWGTGEMRGLVMRHAMGELDKLNRHYILDGFEPGQTSGLPHPFIGDQVNPTGMWRRQARQDRDRVGGTGGFGDLVWSQGVLDPDYFGTFWYGWSVQNPNFWSDVIQRPLFRFTRLQDHPRFAELQRLSYLTLKADLHHSITLPGGAGQECPGYHRHALQIWEGIQDAAGEILRFDVREWDRFVEGEAFLVRSSQPDGGRHRRMIPHGDTHPVEGGPRRVDLTGFDPSSWVTEEFPGFGVIFRNRPGTERETFVTFKAGPNRGHYHGDQLSLHWAADARPLMVDHHVSYNPRAGQEHMHNRLSFGTAEMPWAVMDGHERLLAFETSEYADVAVGEVSSRRLRRMPKLPPEDWDQRWDRHELDGELRYQRAVVMLRGLARDALVLLDAWSGPEALDATFNAHVLGQELETEGPVARAGRRFTAIRLYPQQAEFSRFDFEHSNGGGEQTAGIRWSTHGEKGRFVTVLWPGDDPPAVERIPGGVRVADVEVVFGESVDGGSGIPVQVRRGGAELVSVTELDYNRSQGDIGLFVPDAGYPFGPIPEWLSEQRLARPDWAKELPGLLDPLERW